MTHYQIDIVSMFCDGVSPAEIQKIVKAVTARLDCEGGTKLECVN